MMADFVSHRESTIMPINTYTFPVVKLVRPWAEVQPWSGYNLSINLSQQLSMCCDMSALSGGNILPTQDASYKIRTFIAFISHAVSMYHNRFILCIYMNLRSKYSQYQCCEIHSIFKNHSSVHEICKTNHHAGYMLVKMNCTATNCIT